jgi:hypothetical protein
MKFDPDKEYVVYDVTNYDYKVVVGNTLNGWLKDNYLEEGSTIQELTSKKWVIGTIKVVNEVKNET